MSNYILRTAGAKDVFSHVSLRTVCSEDLSPIVPRVSFRIICSSTSWNYLPPTFYHTFLGVESQATAICKHRGMLVRKSTRALTLLKKNADLRVEGPRISAY